MPPFSERAVHRMTAVKERQHRRTTHSDSFQGSADTEVASCRNHTLFKGVDRFRGAPSLMVDLRQIQIELRVVHSHSQGFRQSDSASPKRFSETAASKPVYER